MGYDTWSAYVYEEWKDALAQIPRETKRKVHQLMRELGTSTRAIAAVTGVAHTTAQRDTPAGANAPAEGRDGKKYPARMNPQKNTIEDSGEPTTSRPSLTVVPPPRDPEHALDKSGINKLSKNVGQALTKLPED